jgi:hypothetical protein
MDGTVTMADRWGPQSSPASSHVLYARIVELEEECDRWRSNMAKVQQEVGVLRRHRYLLDVLRPVAELYVDAFRQDEMMTLRERLRLQEVENALEELASDD